ncbi:MAG: transglycosylase SLT domain-containing protein [Thermodesulfobacteriota bacterium]
MNLRRSTKASPPLLAAFWLIFIVFQVGPAQVLAAVYEFRDKDGTIIITDRPPNDKYKIILTSIKRPKGFKEPVDTGRKYDDVVGQTAQGQGLPYPLLLAIIKTESNFNPKAVSPKGASGLMQLMPDTWKMYGVTDPFDPAQNIRAGTAYFKEQLARFKDVNLALAAYNAGPANVEKYKGIPPFDETQRYVKMVNWYHEHYKNQKDLIKLPGVENNFDQGSKALQTGDLRQAADHFKRVVQTYPASPEANYNLALSYERAGNTPRAISIYKRTLELNPYFKEAYYNLAILYEKLGRDSLAITTWQTYLRYEVKPEEIKLVSLYIKELRQISRQ